ncbi:MAG: hypothetical protein B6I38_00550 [Anaerolineaceae bacterium 4572_5.1]|nr:MAG: hypothetical protein B6I38_00550 [Anaerolineaceae bacterium 4572_5.1]
MATLNQKNLFEWLWKFLLALIFLALPLVPVTAAPLKSPAALYIDPENKTLNVDDSAFTFHLRIQDVNDMGAFGARLTYDPALIDVNVLVLTNFLESTGRQASIIEQSGNGYVEFSAYTMGSEPGASGNGALAQITVTPKSPGVTTLNLSNILITKPLGDSISYTSSNSQITITETELPGDCNADQTVNEADITTLIEVIFQHITGNAGCDANQDNQVDAADITCTTLIYFNGAGACGN